MNFQSQAKLKNAHELKIRKPKTVRRSTSDCLSTQTFRKKINDSYKRSRRANYPIYILYTLSNIKVKTASI